MVLKYTNDITCQYKESIRIWILDHFVKGHKSLSFMSIVIIDGLNLNYFWIKSKSCTTLIKINIIIRLLMGRIQVAPEGNKKITKRWVDWKNLTIKIGQTILSKLIKHFDLDVESCKLWVIYISGGKCQRLNGKYINTSVQGAIIWIYFK